MKHWQKQQQARLNNMAKGSDVSNLDRLAEQIKAGLSDPLATQIDSATGIDATEVIPSDTASAAEPESATPAETPLSAASAPTPSLTDLGAFVANLTPEQLFRVRELARSRGLSAGPRKGPNGGLMVEVEIPAEAVEPLQTWADESGSSFAEFVGKVAGDAIVNYCFGDWGATTVTPAPAVASPAATTT
jgi:hypothetical protein